ncbi:hypothetical protein O1L60_01540 [Streptomyces diastatochromogenes]|nr:hypothetical protein [Streptomyces diastatochromogenes]
MGTSVGRPGAAGSGGDGGRGADPARLREDAEAGDVTAMFRHGLRLGTQGTTGTGRRRALAAPGGAAGHPEAA